MSMLTQKRMAAAKQEIKAGNLEQARRLLDGIDHPSAKKWVEQYDAKYNQQHSKVKTKTKVRRKLLIGIIALVVLIILAVAIGTTLIENHRTQVLHDNVGHQTYAWFDAVVDMRISQGRSTPSIDWYLLVMTTYYDELENCYQQYPTESQNWLFSMCAMEAGVPDAAGDPATWQ